MRAHLTAVPNWSRCATKIWCSPCLGVPSDLEKQTNSFKYFCMQKLHICAVSLSHGRIIYLKQSKNEQSVLFYSNFYSNPIKRASSALLPGHLRLTCGVVWCEWGSMWKRPVAPIKSKWILIAGKLSCFQLCCFCNFQVTQLLDQIIFNLRISAKLFTIPCQSSRFVTWWILKLILWLTCWYFFSAWGRCWGIFQQLGVYVIAPV